MASPDISDRTLRWLHGMAGIAHLVQSAAGFALTNSVYPDEGYFKVNNVLTWQEQVKTYDIGERYRLGNIVCIFPALSSMNHLWAVLDQKRYLGYVEKGYNPVRWIEYSASAGLMFWVIGQLCGIADIKTLTLLLAGNATMQYMGLTTEQCVGRSKKAMAAQQSDQADDWKDMAWEQQVPGFTIFLGMWASLMIGFWTGVKNSKQDVPDTVYSIIFVLFSLMLVFGLLCIAYIRGLEQNTSKSRFSIQSFRKVEVGYIILSLVAKSFLTWMTLFGVLFAQQKN